MDLSVDSGHSLSPQMSRLAAVVAFGSQFSIAGHRSGWYLETEKALRRSRITSLYILLSSPKYKVWLKEPKGEDRM